MRLGAAALWAPLLLGTAAACGDDASGGGPDGAVDGGGATGPITLGGEERPARLVLPADAPRPLPLVVLLHGYSVSATLQDAYFRTSQRARRDGFALLLPDGTFDDSENRFWHALPGFGGMVSDVDDVGYLLGIIDEAIAEHGVDPARVYLLGHSNGAFMAYRIACEAADRIAGMASLAGSSYPDATACPPSRGVPVLQIHGDADDTIPYEGTAEYPGALAMAERWAGIDGCAPTPTAAGTLDFDSGIDGAETEMQAWPGCDTGLDVQLWTIRGGAHLPAVSDEGIDAVLAWLVR